MVNGEKFPLSDLSEIFTQIRPTMYSNFLFLDHFLPCKNTHNDNNFIIPVKKDTILHKLVAWQPTLLAAPENTLHDVTDLGIHSAIFWSDEFR